MVSKDNLKGKDKEGGQVLWGFVSVYLHLGRGAWSEVLVLYCYNFCLDTSPYSKQPSGAMNMSRFTNVQFEFTTITPPVDPYAQVLTICDPTTGEIVGINKPTWRIYDYNFNMYLIEERVNMVTFIGGNAALMYAI